MCGGAIRAEQRGRAGGALALFVLSCAPAGRQQQVGCVEVKT